MFKKLTEEEINNIAKHILNGKKIMAIKELKTTLGCTLSTAKNIIDNYPTYGNYYVDAIISDEDKDQAIESYNRFKQDMKGREFQNQESMEETLDKMITIHGLKEMMKYLAEMI